MDFRRLRGWRNFRRLSCRTWTASLCLSVPDVDVVSVEIGRLPLNDPGRSAPVLAAVPTKGGIACAFRDPLRQGNRAGRGCPFGR